MSFYNSYSEFPIKGSAFSKGPRSAFFQGPGPGPLCKVFPHQSKKAGYRHLRFGNSNMQSLILSKSEGDVFSRPPHANLKGPGSRATATTKMESLTKLPCVWVFRKGRPIYW